MKNLIKRISAAAMTLTLLGTGTAISKSIAPETNTTITASAATPNKALGATIYLTRLYSVINRIPTSLEITKLALDQTSAYIEAKKIFLTNFQIKNLSNKNFVKALYKGLLNRTASDFDINEWTHKLNTGTSRSTVLLSFINSTEFDITCKLLGIKRI